MKNLTELSFEQVHMSLEIREAVVTTVCSTVETVRWDEIQLIHWQGTGSNRSGKNNNNTSKNNDDDSNSSIKKDSYDTDFRIDPTTGHKVYRDPKEVMPRLKQVEVGTFTSERQVERVLSWVRDHGIRLIGYIHWGRRDEKVLRALSGLPSLSTPQPQSPTTVLGAEAASEPISSSSSTYNVATITTPTPLAEGRPSCHCELENIKMNVETRQCWMLGIAGSPLRKAAPWSTSTPATSDSTQFLCLRTLRTLEMHELPLSIIPDYLCSVLERELQQTDEYSRLAHKNRYPTEHGVNFLLSRWWLDQLLTPERLAFHMPVVRTLTRLCIAPEAPYCNRLYKKMDHQVWCLCWLNKLLRGTPELREFVLWFPIKNLFVFGGLGKKRAMEQRQQQQESQQRSAQQARSSSSSSSAVSVAASSMASTTTEEQDDFAQLQNPHQSQHQGQQDPEAREVPAPDWTNERPFLEHVHIVRCHYQADLSLLGMKWRLQQQFRFLKTVRVDEQQLR
ncbi:hypothetical protein BGZ83_010787 [Gryganskiella cystojenkinii]|nr:hypothetical protein BGZ83_010787 [Gryganskiella cystojenkinii]